jgi:hypothetical protein
MGLSCTDSQYARHAEWSAIGNCALRNGSATLRERRSHRTLAQLAQRCSQLFPPWRHVALASGHNGATAINRYGSIGLATCERIKQSERVESSRRRRVARRIGARTHPPWAPSQGQGTRGFGAGQAAQRADVGPNSRTVGPASHDRAYGHKTPRLAHTAGFPKGLSRYWACSALQWTTHWRLRLQLIRFGEGCDQASPEVAVADAEPCVSGSPSG